MFVFVSYYYSGVLLTFPFIFTILFRTQLTGNELPGAITVNNLVTVLPVSRILRVIMLLH